MKYSGLSSLGNWIQSIKTQFSKKPQMSGKTNFPKKLPSRKQMFIFRKYQYNLNTKRYLKMKVERINDEIIIRLRSDKDPEWLQSLLNYLKYEELTSKSTATEKDLEELIDSVKKERSKKRQSMN